MLGVVYLSAIALGLAFLVRLVGQRERNKTHLCVSFDAAQWWLTIPWRTLRGIPGPFPLPIVGNIPEFLRSEQLALYTSLRHRFGGGLRPPPLDLCCSSQLFLVLPSFLLSLLYIYIYLISLLSQFKWLAYFWAHARLFF